MEHKIILSETQVKEVQDIIKREELYEVAMQGKSGKTYSLHGNDPISWGIMQKLRQASYPFWNKKNNNNIEQDEINFYDLAGDVTDEKNMQHLDRKIDRALNDLMEDEPKNKTVIMREDQLNTIYEMALEESLIVNSNLVKSVVAYLNKHFRPVKYDDINADGEVVEPYAIQVLSGNGEPLQTISLATLLQKVDGAFSHKIKNEEDRRKFFEQVIKDWINGNVTKEGILSVNSIK